jgi:hypothetical protein
LQNNIVQNFEICEKTTLFKKSKFQFPTSLADFEIIEGDKIGSQWAIFNDKIYLIGSKRRLLNDVVKVYWCCKDRIDCKGKFHSELLELNVDGSHNLHSGSIEGLTDHTCVIGK